MGHDIRRFIFKILVTAIILFLIAGILFTWFLPEAYLPILPWMLLFFTFVTITTYSYQLKLAGKDMGRFTRSTMIMSLLRILLYSIFAIAYLWVNKQNLEVFVVSLFIIYIIYTFLEVKSIARVIRSKGK